MAVTSQVQQVSGMRIRVMPLRAGRPVVAMKLIAPISEAPQKTAMLRIQSVCPMPCPGPAMRPTALSGGYAVQPASGAPPCDEERRQHDDEREERGPERQHVEDRKRHVLGADLERQEVVAEAALRARW